MRFSDLGIGHRLAIGFTLLLLAILALVIAVSKWHAESASAQRVFVDSIVPLSARVDALERSILYTAIALRSYALRPDDQRLARYHERVQAVRDAVRQVGQFVHSPENDQDYRALEPLVARFLSVADNASDAVARDVLSSVHEANVSEMREAALSRVRGFAELQESRARAGIARMSAAQENVARALQVSAVIALLFSIALAYLTTQSIRRPVRELLRVAAALRDGDWRPALAINSAAADAGAAAKPVRNEMLRLAHAFGAAAAALERREQRLRADGRLAHTISTTLEREKLAKGALSGIVEHARGQIGILYCNDRTSDILMPVAGYAVDSELQSVRIGEGIPGQAAAERRPILMRDLPRANGFRIKAGFDEASPKAVVALPIIFGEEVLGVLLVATVHEIDEDTLAFLSAATVQLALAFQNVTAFERVQRLLGRLQDTNGKMHAQNEELRAQNEEIQAQHEEIQAQHEELQAQSEEIQAQNEQLQQQTEDLGRHAGLLAEADERKNAFLAVLAHELRNPLGAITNGLAVIDRAAPGAAPARAAQTIIARQARHLTRLIDDLLDITRISRGKIQIERRPVNLAQIMLDCVEDHRAASQAKDVQLTVDVPDSPVWVSGDGTRLWQVIGNLLNNAIKFSARGQAVVVTLIADHALRQARVHVLDAGCGIDARLTPQLFEPFSQASTSLHRTDAGLGLGLALVKSFVELHGGGVDASSGGPDKGAEFVVRLPLTDPPALEQATPAFLPAPCRILIVEDNIDAAESLRTAIELEGHRVHVVHTGSAAAPAAREFKPDVLLCDIGLPEMDGYEVARAFCADSQLRSVLLVAVTGYATDADRQRAAQAGFEFHLPKPLEVRQLAEVLSHVHCEPTSSKALFSVKRLRAAGTSARAEQRQALS